MRRKITVYGLRFSKTTFWNRLNTGFLEPAVATALTACGIETHSQFGYFFQTSEVATALTACGIETWIYFKFWINHIRMLQRRLPLAVLKLFPLMICVSFVKVATALTACGIETKNIGTKDEPVS